MSWLKQFPEFADLHTAKTQAVDAPAVVELDAAETTPDEQLAEAHQALLQSLAD